jgi:hypothetical protein
MTNLPAHAIYHQIAENGFASIDHILSVHTNITGQPAAEIYISRTLMDSLTEAVGWKGDVTEMSGVAVHIMPLDGGQVITAGYVGRRMR